MQSLFTPTLRGLPRDRVGSCAQICAQIQVRTLPKTRHTHRFWPGFQPIVDSVNLSPAPEFFSSVLTEAFFAACFDGAPPKSPTTSSRRPEKELIQDYSDRSERHIQRIVSIVIERDELSVFFSNAEKRTYELEKELNTIKVEKQALVVTVELHVSQIRTL